MCPTDRPIQLPDFLGIIEVNFHARKKEQYAASKSVRSTSTGSSPQIQVKKDPTALRYTAYNTPPPTSAQRSKPKRQDSFNSLESYTSAPQRVSNLPVVKNNWLPLSPDMVDLAQSVAGGSSRSVSPVVRRQVRPFPFFCSKKIPKVMEFRTRYIRPHHRKPHIGI